MTSVLRNFCTLLKVGMIDAKQYLDVIKSVYSSTAIDTLIVLTGMNEEGLGDVRSILNMVLENGILSIDDVLKPESDQEADIKVIEDFLEDKDMLLNEYSKAIIMTAINNIKIFLQDVGSSLKDLLLDKSQKEI